MAFDTHSLLAYSTVIGGGVVNSTTGTSIYLTSTSAFASGGNQNITVWPSGVNPTTTNAEIMRVTNNNTQNNTLTVTRAQEGSTALGNIAVGYQVANTITPKVLTDIESGGNLTNTAIATNGIAAANLATNAITLGYAQITSGFSTSSTSATLVTGLTSTVTIPAGGRYIKITAYCANLSTATGVAGITFSIWDGTVGSGTQLNAAVVSNSLTTTYQMGIVIAVVQPAAGSKTYNVGVQTGNAADAVTVPASSTYPAFILVEAI